MPDTATLDRSAEVVAPLDLSDDRPALDLGSEERRHTARASRYFPIAGPTNASPVPAPPLRHTPPRDMQWAVVRASYKFGNPVVARY